MQQRLFGQIEADVAAKYCLYIGLVNMLVAAAATIPMIIPELGLPLVIEQWPGTWMFIAYFILLTCGVLGFLSWGFLYYLCPRVLRKQNLNRFLSFAHIAFFEGSLLSIVTLMGLVAGYRGGTLLHNGFGQFIVTRVIEWIVIPIGTLIVVALIATMLGVLNIILSPTSR